MDTRELAGSDVTILGIPMLRGSIPTVQMVIATVALGLLAATAFVR